MPSVERPGPVVDHTVVDPVAAPETAEVLGVPLALTDYEGTLDWIDETVVRGAGEYDSAAATLLVRAAQDDPTLRAAVLGSALVVPDGQPLVWALKALGHEIEARGHGPDLMDRACE